MNEKKQKKEKRLTDTMDVGMNEFINIIFIEAKTITHCV